MWDHDYLFYLIIFLLNFYFFFIFVDAVYHFLVGVIFPLKVLGMILNHTVQRGFWPPPWRTALFLGPRTSGERAKGAESALLCRAGSPGRSVPVASVNCFSITKDPAHSPNICTLIPEILSSHLSFL